MGEDSKTGKHCGTSLGHSEMNLTPKKRLKSSMKLFSFGAFYFISSVEVNNIFEFYNGENIAKLAIE